MSEAAPARLLAWDTEFFARRIARVDAARLDPPAARRVIEWARAEDVACLYFLADAADFASVHAAEDVGFRLVDLRVTRAHELGGRVPGPVPGVEPVRTEDVPALCAIARANHDNTRFFHDPHFPRERCEALYETWIRNACAGDADLVLVARHAGKPAGYVTAVLEAAARGRLELAAVASEARRRGLGERLFTGALAWLAAQGCRRVELATQGHVATARFYEKLDFRTQAVECWMHCWPGDPGTPP